MQRDKHQKKIEKIVERMHDYFYPKKQPDQNLISLTSPDEIIRLIMELENLNEAQKADILSRGGAPKKPNPLQEVMLKHFSEALDKKVKPIGSSVATPHSANSIFPSSGPNGKEVETAAATYRPEIMSIINMIEASNNLGAIKLIQKLDTVQPGEREYILKKISETAVKGTVEEKISLALAKKPQGTTTIKP